MNQLIRINQPIPLPFQISSGDDDWYYIIADGRLVAILVVAIDKQRYHIMDINADHIEYGDGEFIMEEFFSKHNQWDCSKYIRKNFHVEKVIDDMGEFIGYNIFFKDQWIANVVINEWDGSHIIDDYDLGLLHEDIFEYIINASIICHHGN